ncbi:MAG: TolC family protein, partial [Bacteroidaceae bacterium]|nr:TolC family protein [Bacteroidaceae bacterium]
VIQAKELGDVARAYKAMLDELKKNVEGAFHHGMSTRNDIMKVQVKQNEAELNIQKADNGYRLACMNLCHITGMPLDSEIEVEAMNTDSQKDTVIEGGVVSSRPEASILEHKTELARQKVKLTKSDYLPNISVGASYTYANAGELAGKRLIDDGALSVGVAVNVPLDLFGSVSNKVRSAKAAYQIAQLEEQDLNEQMQLELSQCRNLYEEAQTELNLSKVAFEQAKENMRLSKQQYEVGFETLSDYMETQAMWQQCNANLVNARCQQQLAYVRLLKAAGMLR